MYEKTVIETRRDEYGRIIERVETTERFYSKKYQEELNRKKKIYGLPRNSTEKTVRDMEKYVNVMPHASMRELFDAVNEYRENVELFLY